MWTNVLVAPNTFEQTEVSAPEASDLAADQAILRVLVGGICGSDLPYFMGRLVTYGGVSSEDGPAPTPPGGPLHEVVGEVVASTDPSLALGSLVVGWASHRNAMSEYIIVDGADVFPFSADLSPSTAIMLQPLACVLYAVDSLTDLVGASAAVIGQGPIGVLFSHVLKSAGAASVTGVDRINRADIGKTYGVDEVVWGTSDRWAEDVRIGNADAPDVVVETVGHQVSTLSDAVRVLRDSGQIYYFGVPDDPVYPFPMLAFLRKNGRLLSGFTRQHARREVLRRAADYLDRHPEIAVPYISRRYPFTRATEAFTDASRPAAGRLKVILEA